MKNRIFFLIDERERETSIFDDDLVLIFYSFVLCCTLYHCTLDTFDYSFDRRERERSFFLVSVLVCLGLGVGFLKNNQNSVQLLCCTVYHRTLDTFLLDILSWVFCSQYPARRAKKRFTGGFVYRQSFFVINWLFFKA